MWYLWVQMLLQFYTILYAYVMAWRYWYAWDKIPKFCFCFMFCEIKLIHDSSYIFKDKTYSGGGHKFSEFAC